MLRIGADYGTRAWAVQAAFIGSFFQNDTQQMTWDNPFRLTTEQINNPLTGRMALYPDNHAYYASFAGATDVTKYLRFSASITPGWLRQNEAFLPYTTNTAINTCGTGAQACDSTARSAGVKRVRKQTDAGDELQPGDDRLERHSV